MIGLMGEPTRIFEMTSCLGPDWVRTVFWLDIGGRSLVSSYQDRLQELQLHFNGAFHKNLAVPVCEHSHRGGGSKPGVPWRDKSSGSREKQAARRTATKEAEQTADPPERLNAARRGGE